MEYKLIKKFLPGLNLNYQAGDYSADAYVVTLSNLEAELAKGVELFGLYERGPSAFSLRQCSGDTHSGLLIGYQPIESSKPVSREEIINLLISKGLTDDQELILERIKKNGVK